VLKEYKKVKKPILSSRHHNSWSGFTLKDTEWQQFYRVHYSQHSPIYLRKRDLKDSFEREP